MLILNTAGDTIRAEASVASSVTISCYGIETASGADAYKRLGVAQLTGPGTQDIIYTVPASTVTICSVIVIANTSGSSCTVKLWDVENAGSPGDANAILGTIPLPSNTTVVWNKGNLSVFPAVGGIESLKVKIDAGAIAGYIGAANSDGVLRTGSGLVYTDGGDFVTLTADVGIADDKIMQVDDADAVNADYARFTANGLQGRDVTEVKADLGLVIGTNVQAYDAGLLSLAGLSYTAASFIKMTGADTFALRTISEVKTDLSLNNVSNVATDDTAYNATSWNANTDAATKNVIRDKVETMDTSIGSNTTHRGLTSGNPHVVTPTELSLLIGTDVLAQQTIGIADNNLLEVDHVSPADNDYAKFTAAGLEGRSYSEVRTDLGLVIGTDVQAYDAELASLAGLTYAAASFVKMTGAGTFALRTIGETADDLEGTIDHNNLANTHGAIQPLDSGLTSLAGLTYATASFVKMTGADTFALRTIAQTADDLEGTIDHANLANRTIVAHDTTATGANLTSLIDNSMVDTLHRHSELSASDGTPDATLSIDAAGILTCLSSSYFGGGTRSNIYRFHAFRSVEDSEGRCFLAETEVTGGGTSIVSGMTNKVTAIDNMSDGFGAGHLFAIQDDEGIERFISRIAAVRDGSDITGKFQIDVWRAGVRKTVLMLDNSIANFVDQDLETTGLLRMKEKAASNGDIAGYGQLWVKNTIPCELWFTSDTGVDTKIV